MSYITPCFSRSEVRRAGEILVDSHATLEYRVRATQILTNWRACHGYLLNTFQATLRNKLKGIDKTGVVGQRLKRAPSVISKLQRFDTMKLHQMQDIAGLRAIVESVSKLRKLQERYVDKKFPHELVKFKDYIDKPKDDGYRSVHLVYKYKNKRAPIYNDLQVELQLRTKLQHAWATAVETVDAFMEEGIKAGRPSKPWASFFQLASAAFCHIEKTPRLSAYYDTSFDRLRYELRKSEKSLDVLLKLSGFSIAANNISTQGSGRSAYHLVVLNMSERRLNIKSFPLSEQDAANAAYAEVEDRARNGEYLDPVLITGGTVHGLRKAYPNYFLDSQAFVELVQKIL